MSTSVQYLFLARIKNSALFAEYIQGHLPTLAAFGGKVVFRSGKNLSVFGGEEWDVVAMQEWPSTAAFERWWTSDEYRPWGEIRDLAAQLVIIQCRNDLPIATSYTSPGPPESPF